MRASTLKQIALIFILTIFQGNLYSQALTFTVPGPLCINGTAMAAVVSTPSNAAFYTWAGNPAVLTGSVNSANTQMNITFPSCGIHTITCFAYNSSSSLIATTSSTINVSCAGITVTPSSQTICAGGSATIIAGGASSYSWNTGANTNSITPSPVSNAIYTVSGNTGCSTTASVTIFNLTVSASATSLCPSAQVTLTAIGGSSYSWFQPPNSQFAATTSISVITSPTVLPITYTVVGIFGTSCISVKTISLGLFPYTIKATAPASVCSGVTSSISCLPASSFTWSSPGQTTFGNPFVFSQSVATTYTVSADSLNCKDSKTITVGMHPNPTLIITASSATICPNQVVNLFVSGAVNYTWVTHPSLLSSLFGSSVAAGPLVSTVYSVSGTNTFGCRGFSNYTVNVGIFPSLTAAPISTALCAGFVTTLAAFGANGYTWTSSTFTNQITTPTLSGGAGSYTVYGSNGGTCRDSTTIIIILNPPLNILTTQSSSATCIKDNGLIDPVNFTASGASTYTWAPFTPGLMTYSLGSNTSVTPTVTTCYTVTGATSDCTGKAVLCVVSGYCADLKNLSQGDGLKIFPNPAGNRLFIELSATSHFSIQLINAQGQILLSENIENSGSEAKEIFINDLPSGIYSALIISADGPQKVVKVVKE